MLLYSSFVRYDVSAQITPAANAIKLNDSLVFSTTLTVPNSTVVFNPQAHKYYSVRLGNVAYPIETWNQTGGLSIFQDTTAFDTRGMWWNPNTNKIERNGFNTFGWSTVELNGNSNATHNLTMIYSGSHQPNPQSMGTYDSNTNTVLFNNSGTISEYSRATGNLINTIPLLGVNLSSTQVSNMIFTGVVGYEIGLLDYTNKRILFFNRSTGVYSGTTQLPASQVLSNNFNFSYTNNKVWLFNVSQKKWNSYYIWSQQLPVSLISFNASISGYNSITCEWVTASQTDNNYFTLEHSIDGIQYLPIAIIAGGGKTQQLQHYSYKDIHVSNGVHYYRLQQTDYNGKQAYSKVIQVGIADPSVKLGIITNRSSQQLVLMLSIEKNISFNIEIYNSEGKLMLAQHPQPTSGNNIFTLNIPEWPSGFYILRMNDEKSTVEKKFFW